MTPRESTKLIEAAGGDTAFAELLGISGSDSYRQRVNNWKRRGIPPAVQLQHQELFQRLLTESPKARRAS
jgi:hypothetical protein